MPSVDDLWEGFSRRARETERACGVKRWVARWRTADGKTRKKRLHTRDEALTHALSDEDEDWLASLSDVAPSSRTERITTLRKALALAGLPDVTDGLAVRQRRTIQDFLTIDELVR